MKLNKGSLFMSVYIIFWVCLIGWGMFKTNLKLSKLKPEAEPIAQHEPIIQHEPIPQTNNKEPEPEPVVAKIESRPVLVRAFKAKAADFKDTLPVMGTVKGKTEIEIRFEINGIIKTIYFREGERVKKGDAVACLEPKDAELKFDYGKNKFNSAQASYDSSKKKLEVHQKLYEAGAIIQSKFEEVQLESESAKFQVETARSEMELAENELKKTFFYAPKDAVMGPREAEEGEFVTPQDKVGSLFEIGEVFVEVGIVERDIQKIKVGQKAAIYVDAYPDIAFEGNVENIFPIVEGKSRTLTVKIKVSNPKWLLFPGMFSRAEILIAELKDAFIVPASCVIPGPGGTTLLPVIPAESIGNGKEEAQVGFVQLKKARLGYQTSDYAQVTEGLNADDLVALEAQGELKDNTRVKILETEEISF